MEPWVNDSKQLKNYDAVLIWLNTLNWIFYAAAATASTAGAAAFTSTAAAAGTASTIAAAATTSTTTAAATASTTGAATVFYL